MLSQKIIPLEYPCSYSAVPVNTVLLHDVLVFKLKGFVHPWHPVMGVQLH